eukprot:gb/GFBE01018169.1/.p1 GENE.gb/GFBE01018169.1/~~gb/GFBE01018169.1/.p1  ORF type:complete len:186 (+),score=32.45 gb/GFBE01018169.1/:1-558(+)
MPGQQFASAPRTFAGLQLQLPLRPPPGLEKFGPKLPQDGDTRSEASTEATEEAASTPRGASWSYCPGEALQLAAGGLRNLRLEEVLPPAALPEGPPECPSLGSAGHHLGLCKPCDFMYRSNCRSGYSCNFCHLCPPGETRRRKKQKQVATRIFKRMAATAAWPEVPTDSKGPKPNPTSLCLDQLV